MTNSNPSCRLEEHSSHTPGAFSFSAVSFERAAHLFEALGDLARLRLLSLLAQGEMCVTEIAAFSGEGLSTVSQRLRLLKTERLVVSRRSGKHIFYRLADGHIYELVLNALRHTSEVENWQEETGKVSTTKKRGIEMSEKHPVHEHTHGTNCGHTAVIHEGHTDYLHDGHLHHPEADGSVEEHVIAISITNPAGCTPGHNCGGHAAEHQHGPGCGDEAVPHGDHVDYLVQGHLHHPHGDHCDDHGKVSLI